MRPPGTPAQLPVRRRKEVALLAEVQTPAAVAKQLKCSRSSLDRWKVAADEGGNEALKPKAASGRPPFLSPSEQQRLLKILMQGPRKSGYATEMWTCMRVPRVIERHFRVNYHPDYVGTLLHKIGWSPQKPTNVGHENVTRKKSMRGVVDLYRV
jgi:transposase